MITSTPSPDLFGWKGPRKMAILLKTGLLLTLWGGVALLSGCNSGTTTAQDEAKAKQRAEEARKALPAGAIGGVSGAPHPVKQGFAPPPQRATN